MIKNKIYLKLIRFFIWAPIVVACICAFLALCKVGYPAEWSWWVFPTIGFAPIAFWFIVGLLDYILMMEIPPKTADGGYYLHQAECGFMKPVRVARYGRQGREFKAWYMKEMYPLREGKKKTKS